MATEYGIRLQLAMRTAGLNQKALIKVTGMAQSSVSSAMNRGSGSADTPKLAKACGVSALWLATGEGEMIPQGIINRQQVGLEALAPVSIAPAAIKDIADPLMAMAVIYDMLPPEQRRDAVAAATKAMAAFLGQKTFVNHENPASHQDVPEFSHAAIRNKAA